MGIVWAILVVPLIFLLVRFFDESQSKGKNVSALELLKQRYAKGEISKEEFEEKKEAIK